MAAASTALRTDHYELTMLAGALRSGIASHRATFEVFARELPPGRRYGVVAGTARVVEAIRAFRFDDGILAFLERTGVVGRETLDHLARWRFTGDVVGYGEGECYFADSPVLTVEAPFGEAVLLETIVLSILNHDSAVAAAGARMDAVTDAPLVEMGGRRTHEEAAVAAARAAWLVGFDATSNLEAGRRHGIPTMGTVAHAFVLAHPDERAAYLAQLRTLGVSSTILVDTFDTRAGLHLAVEAAHELGAAGPGSVRIDSGDLLTECRAARVLLDDLGAARSRIIASGDLDEHRIAALERAPGGRAPIDGYGVGTQLVTGSGHPTAGFVYKLVAVADRPGAGAPEHAVAKTSPGKATAGGRKAAWRVLGADGRARVEDVRTDGRRPTGGRPLQMPLVLAGEPVALEAPEAARERHRRARAELPDDALEPDPGPPALPTALDGTPA